MLYEDEDDIFMGSPRSKFFDILFNANRNLVEHKLETMLERYAAMEHLLEEKLEGEDIQRMADSFIIENPDMIHQKKTRPFYSNSGRYTYAK